MTLRTDLSSRYVDTRTASELEQMYVERLSDPIPSYFTFLKGIKPERHAGDRPTETRESLYKQLSELKSTAKTRLIERNIKLSKKLAALSSGEFTHQEIALRLLKYVNEARIYPEQVWELAGRPTWPMCRGEKVPTSCTKIQTDKEADTLLLEEQQALVAEFTEKRALYSKLAKLPYEPLETFQIEELLDPWKMHEFEKDIDKGAQGRQSVSEFLQKQLTECSKEDARQIRDLHYMLLGKLP